MKKVGLAVSFFVCIVLLGCDQAYHAHFIASPEQKVTYRSGEEVVTEVKNGVKCSVTVLQAGNDPVLAISIENNTKSEVTIQSSDVDLIGENGEKGRKIDDSNRWILGFSKSLAKSMGNAPAKTLYEAKTKYDDERDAKHRDEQIASDFDKYELKHETVEPGQRMDKAVMFIGKLSVATIKVENQVFTFKFGKKETPAVANAGPASN